jgi:hypothetical protein
MKKKPSVANFSRDKREKLQYACEKTVRSETSGRNFSKPAQKY